MIAARRTLHIKSPDGERTVEVTIDLPRYEGEAWVCEYSIGWPEGPFTHQAAGFDSAQVLQSALKMVAIQLYASPYHKAGTLYFQQPGSGYGFILPAGGRDLAIGDDQGL